MIKRIAVLLGILSLGVLVRADVSTTTVNQNRLGMYGNEGGITQTIAIINTELALIQATGVKTYRWNSDFWASVETASGTFDYTKLDQIVAIVTGTASGQYGMDMILTMPISASWTPKAETCPQNEPYTGSAVGCTHFPTNDMGLLYRFYNNIATRYGNNILYEVWNEPDNPAFWKASLFPDTTGYILVATTAYVAIKAGAPTAEVLLGPIAFPRGSVLTGSTTHYAQHHYDGELLAGLAGNATNYTLTYHNYYDGEGGGVTSMVALSSMTAIAKANSCTPTFIVDEINKFGGSFTTGDHEAEEVGKSSFTLRSFALLFSTNAANGAVVKRILFHDLKGLDFSALDTSYNPRYSYYTVGNFAKGLNGYTPQGEQSSGNTHILKFTSGSSAKYVAWTESGTASWTPSPAPSSAIRTDVYGNSSVVPGASFNPFSLTPDPAIFNFTSQSYQLQGVTLRGITLQ